VRGWNCWRRSCSRSSLTSTRPTTGFDFGVSTGLQPRLWVDAVAHVHMGRDRRIYRFVRDTRLGRKVISDTSDMAATADAVARYIAERVIERERILAGDFETLRESMGESVDAAPAKAE
jgi:hypothetical protein